VRPHVLHKCSMCVIHIISNRICLYAWMHAVHSFWYSNSGSSAELLLLTNRGEDFVHFIFWSDRGWVFTHAWHVLFECELSACSSFLSGCTGFCSCVAELVFRHLLYKWSLCAIYIFTHSRLCASILTVHPFWSFSSRTSVELLLLTHYVLREESPVVWIVL
jgi:hypothetical protein